MSKKTAKQITRINREFVIIKNGEIFLQESGDYLDVIRRKVGQLQHFVNEAKTTSKNPFCERALHDFNCVFEDLDNYITAVQSLQTIQPFAL